MKYTNWIIKYLIFFTVVLQVKLSSCSIDDSGDEIKKEEVEERSSNLCYWIGGGIGTGVLAIVISGVCYYKKKKKIAYYSEEMLQHSGSLGFKDATRIQKSQQLQYNHDSQYNLQQQLDTQYEKKQEQLNQSSRLPRGNDNEEEKQEVYDKVDDFYINKKNCMNWSDNKNLTQLPKELNDVCNLFKISEKEKGLLMNFIASDSQRKNITDSKKNKKAEIRTGNYPISEAIIQEYFLLSKTDSQFIKKIQGEMQKDSKFLVSLLMTEDVTTKLYSFKVWIRDENQKESL